MKKKILLTGASGFVGRQIGKALLDNGHELVLPMRPGGLERSGLVGDEIAIVETQDLFAEREDAWAKHLDGVDAVIHAAWYVEPGKYLDSPKNMECVEGSLRLAAAVQAAGIHHFIGIGTCFEYRLPNDHITIEAETGPFSPYAAAKLALLHMLERRFEESMTRLTWARLFYLFGEGENAARLYPMLHRKLSSGEPVPLSSGDKVRDFLDVAEAGRMIAHLVDTAQAGVVNICSGEAVTIRKIAESIADHYGRRDLLEFGTASIHPHDHAAVVGVPNLIA